MFFLEGRWFKIKYDFFSEGGWFKMKYERKKKPNNEREKERGKE